MLSNLLRASGKALGKQHFRFSRNVASPEFSLWNSRIEYLELNHSSWTGQNEEKLSGNYTP